MKNKTIHRLIGIALSSIIFVSTVTGLSACSSSNGTRSGVSSEQITSVSSQSSRSTRSSSTSTSSAASAATTTSPTATVSRISTPSAASTPSVVSETPSSSGSHEMTYVLNTNSMKFHYPSCSSAKQISAANRQEFTGTREEVVARGYEPCGRCDP